MGRNVVARRAQAVVRHDVDPVNRFGDIGDVDLVQSMSCPRISERQDAIVAQVRPQLSQQDFKQPLFAKTTYQPASWTTFVSTNPF